MVTLKRWLISLIFNYSVNHSSIHSLFIITHSPSPIDRNRKSFWHPPPPPHELLKSKLFSYGIGGKTLKWINAFLCYRQQRVVVNGIKSDWAPVVSGVPQGTVLGPLLFSLHINDITADKESEIRLFADDCVCYREMISPSRFAPILYYLLFSQSLTLAMMIYY